MKNIAIIGGGISGLSVAKMLGNDFEVQVFEKDSRPGGLIKCKRVDGNLYHMVGGHVFNSKRQDVLDYFWSICDMENEFVKATRNAKIYIDKPIGYPIENHLYELDPEVTKAVIDDLLVINKCGYPDPVNFEDFLKHRFGETLYNLYFKPYNEKIWKMALSTVPISWLEGKLPMPSVEEILFSNIHKQEETKMVHSSFYYPKVDGSQFLVDRLAENTAIECNADIRSISYLEDDKKWVINESRKYDYVIFAGNIKSLPGIVDASLNLEHFSDDIQALGGHGTTTVLCELEPNPYSWVYLPESSLASHRIICTGNFSETNNRKGVKTATIEFTDLVEKGEIIDTLGRLPFKPRYISHQYTEYTYPIQEKNTRSLISSVKKATEPKGMYLLGRFAEWEYYNMDAAMGAAIDLSKKIIAAQ